MLFQVNSNLQPEELPITFFKKKITVFWGQDYSRQSLDTCTVTGILVSVYWTKSLLQPSSKTKNTLNDFYENINN